MQAVVIQYLQRQVRFALRVIKKIKAFPRRVLIGPEIGVVSVYSRLRSSTNVYKKVGIEFKAFECGKHANTVDDN